MKKRKRLILVCEDEEPMLNALYEKLTRSGFRVLKARNGEEGLKIALKEKPELIVLDILMSVMDGITMRNKLRQDRAYGKDVPIFFLTNYDAPEIMKRLIPPLDNGRTIHFPKATTKLETIVKKIKEKLHEN